MKFFIIAGEASGDMHGSNLVNAIKKQMPDANFRGFGGERLMSSGVEIIRDLDKLNIMGFLEVVQNLGTIRESFRICKEAMEKERPDAIILIDYPGFNLRMAKWAKQRGIRVFYYISPQVWAWKESRVKEMKKHIDRLMVILPFEKEFFANRGMEVDFVGHPLIDEIETRGLTSDVRHQTSDLRKENVIALLPGSRKQEINHILPVMLELQGKFPDCQFVIGKAPSMDESFYREGFQLGQAEISTEGTSKLLARSKAALVASGTATLETALLNVPQVVCYKASAISVMIARQLIKVPYISLVNLILNKPSVKELIQDDMTVENISAELKLLLEPSERKTQMEADYRELWTILGGGGASEKAAALIANDMRNK